ncbi:COP9 signalosome complex subunit 3 isoform X2 [Lethenteron reissneri]|nr:COP9 signalosome complex subunit 3 isoform X2 [Lethenteron reissneri]
MPNVPDFETLFSQVQLFIGACNGEHIRFATDSFAGLCHMLTNALVERKQALRGISILRQAIDKMQMSATQLTSIHADLCQLCLLAKCFKPALPYLDTDMMDICKENGAFDAKHFLCYYYYGGMIYTGLKNFDRALYFYEQAITTPAMAVSHIMLESYKKYIVVSLILHGKVLALPKYTSQIVGRFIKPLSSAYHELAQAYATNNPSELRGTVAKHSETFANDSNMGLVKQCVCSLYKKNIQRLTKTFLTLSLQDMANRVQLSGPREAEKYVLHMIEDGEIFASINQKDGMVCFHDNPEKYNNPAMLLYIDQEMQKVIELDEKLRAMDQEITINPQFVQKVKPTELLALFSEATWKQIIAQRSGLSSRGNSLSAKYSKRTLILNVEGKTGVPGEESTRPQGEHANSKYTAAGVRVGIEPTDLLHTRRARQHLLATVAPLSKALTWPFQEMFFRNSFLK